MSSLVDHILHFHGPWAYLLIAALCFSESAFVIAFFIPGETALIFGGVLASEHRVGLPLMIVAAILSTVLGYFVGFAIGRRFGSAILGHRWLAGRSGITRTQATIAQRGGFAVLIARFIPVVRAFMPGVAGASGVELRLFSIANVVGGAIWGCGYVVAGFVVGQAYRRFVHDASTVGIFLGAAVVIAVGVHLVHSRRRRAREAL